MTTTAPTAVRAEYTNGVGPDLPADTGLAHLIDRGLARWPERVALSFPTGDGWQERTWTQVRDDVLAAARGLLGRGVTPGDRVAILGRNSYAWAVADLAAATVGIITVPIYPTSSAAQIRHILLDSGAVACLVEDGRAGDVPDLAPDHVHVLDDLLTGADVDAGVLATARDAVRADDVASIVYTSGTTGRPKGCVLTHRNMFVSASALVEQSAEVFAGAVDERPATIAGLPLAHVFGRTILHAGLASGSRTGITPGVPEMVMSIAAFEPTWLAVVPYALEKLRKAVLGAGGGPGRHPLLGSALRHVICGGARMDPRIAEFYAGHGVAILQAYGLTESATGVTLNVPSTNRYETVGRPIPGTTVAVATDGELLVRGGQCSPGYWPDPRASPDGWLHTGDLAEIDGDGFVRITGRRKEILVTTGGKNVAPVPLEDRLRLHPLVADAMVVGDDRPYVTALIVLDPTADADPADPAVRSTVDEVVAAANTEVSQAESIRRWTFVPRPFSVEEGHLTATLKLRRAEIETAFRTQIEELYP